MSADRLLVRLYLMSSNFLTALVAENHDNQLATQGGRAQTTNERYRGGKPKLLWSGLTWLRPTETKVDGRQHGMFSQQNGL